MRPPSGGRYQSGSSHSRAADGMAQSARSGPLGAFALWRPTRGWLMYPRVRIGRLTGPVERALPDRARPSWRPATEVT